MTDRATLTEVAGGEIHSVPSLEVAMDVDEPSIGSGGNAAASSADGVNDPQQHHSHQQDISTIPPVLDFSLIPLCVATAEFNDMKESTVGVPTENNFLKGAAFSPDGTCLLTASEDTVLRVFEVPSHGLQEEIQGLDCSDAGVTGLAKKEWQSCLHSVEGETVYDFAWYPYMSSGEPATCVYVSTSRDHPLHLWDAFTGSLRATYRAYDHLDEVVAANSVCFNTGGNKIFAGYNRMIRVFDVAEPGRSFEARPTCKTRKSPVGQRGIISSLAFSPTAFGGGLFAAGSYARTICLYSANSRGRAVAEFSTPTMGGVTHLQFAPGGLLLFSGSRKDFEIICWDVRHTKQALHSFRRAADTNQRIEFDIDPSGAYLATGSTAREALVYDIQSLALIKTIDNQADAVSSVCFHPYAALLAVGTGQRHFNLDTINAESDSDEMLQDSASEGSNCCSKEVQNGVAIYRIRKTRGIVESKR